jgi:nucleotide-binding universal stress UspA family protein
VNATDELDGGPSAPLALRLVSVGANGSDESYGAVAWAAHVAKAFEAELEVFDAVETDDREMGSAEAIAHPDQVSARLSRHLAERGLAVDAVRVEHGSVTEVATRRPGAADLLVIGGHANDGMRSCSHRDIVAGLARELDCPIVIVPPGDWLADPLPIMVGVDGSEGNSAVLRWARWFSEGLERRLVAVHVSDPMFRTFAPTDRLGREDVAVRHEVDSNRVEFVERVAADPGRSLADYAMSRPFGLIIVGARVRHSFGGRLLGGVASSLIDTARCPVAIVPRAYQVEH